MLNKGFFMKNKTRQINLSHRWNKYKTKATCNLSLYSPTVLENELNKAIVDHNGKILYYGKPILYDSEKKLFAYDPTHYSNFTLVLNRDGTLWYEANRFLVDLVKYDDAYLETQRISRQTIDDLGTCLQKYKWFCDEQDDEKIYELLDTELSKVGLPTKVKIDELVHKLEDKEKFSEEETKQLLSLPTWLNEMKTKEKKIREKQSKEPPFWKVAKRPTSRPNYLYREYLKKRIRDNDLAPSTAEKYLRPITMFYNFIIEEYGSSYLVLGNMVTMPGKVTSYIKKTEKGFVVVQGNEANKVPKCNNSDKESLGYIRDSGYTKPLSEVHQKKLFELIHQVNQPEMSVSHLFAAIVATRVRTVFTLRLCHFMKSLPVDSTIISLDTWRKENDIYEDNKVYRIKVGPTELVDTKGLDAEYSLKVPGYIMKYMQQFSMSGRTRHRRANIKFPQPNPLHEYIFITKNFNPYYCAKGDLNKKQYSRLPDGNAMRQFNASEITPNIDFEYKFHFLRATALWNMLKGLIQQGYSEDKALEEVKNFAGHKRKETTKGYLDWKPNEELRYKAFDDHAKKLYGWAGVEINDNNEIEEVEEEVSQNTIITVRSSKEDLLSENKRLKAEIEHLKSSKNG